MRLLIIALEGREKEGSSPVHVINIEIQDNHEEATLGAFLICELVTLVSPLPQEIKILFFGHGTLEGFFF